MLSLPGGRGKGEECLIEAVCKIRFDASPGEDKACGIWTLCGGTSEEAGEETQQLRLSRFYVSLRTQPKREIHGACTDDAQTAQPRPDGDRSMVPRTSSGAGGAAAEDPQRQAPGPLPVLRAADELSVSLEVLSWHLSTLVLLAQSPNARVAADVGSIQCPPPPVTSVAPSDVQPRTEVVSSV